ncbi:peptide ABC transporter substrate-binding protein [Fredinandcohnia sp. SECRCQ15]|uniref:Peptide ABC transporter substrate-binding protein n=1 Tax=Fredinandcohnia quinoae TaxID=2918902 RepID=A0AAW5E3T7_9BACI|nr:peptide ABC transporter substrate-binding protein [Fredinandcohnia sp. SECRCQ15]MCH1626219.1 peptide ABC transporter substrate-binding protein [Fredinandcohnia sp. SECRCQ15]
MKKSSYLVCIQLIVFLLLSGCGNFDNNDDNTGESKNGEHAQELRINIKSEPPTLHPGLATDSTSGVVLRHAFEGLTRVGEDGKPHEAMAEKIDISEDKKTYTFTIRDANWSNGDKVTAHDFEYAWKWVLDPKNQSDYASIIYNYIAGAKEAYNTKDISIDKMNNVGIKATDDKTLVVNLTNPADFFLELTAFYTYLPVNSKTAKENPDWANKVDDNYVMNGPFVITDKSASITLEKNKDYWDSDTVKLEKITMDMIDDENTEYQSFKKGELDWAGAPTSALPTDVIPQLEKEGTLQTKVIAGTYWFKFNITKEPFNNANIRKALTYAINRKAIIENITQGGQKPAMAVVPTTMIKDNEKGYFKDNDIDTAKELLTKGLKELGLTDASQLPAIALSYNTSEAHQKIAQAIQDMWRKNLGIDVTLSNAEWAVFLDNVDQGNFQIARGSWLADFNDPVNFLEIFTEPKGNNDTGWSNSGYNKLLTQASVETDSAKRLALLKDAEEILMDEMPIAPLYFYTENWIQNEKLKGVVISPLGDVQYKWAYFE